LGPEHHQSNAPSQPLFAREAGLVGFNALAADWPGRFGLHQCDSGIQTVHWNFGYQTECADESARGSVGALNVEALKRKYELSAAFTKSVSIFLSPGPARI
jgi:hypothetical protein